MHEFNNEMIQNSFSAVAHGTYLYVLHDRSMYRLQYRDVTATWEKMPDLIDDHGSFPPAVIVAGAIIIAGGSYVAFAFTKSTTKYDISLNRWEKLKDKQLATIDSANVASQGYVFCLGGLIGGIVPTDKVERLNLESQIWDEVASMQDVRHDASAVDCGRKIIVAGGKNSDFRSVDTVESYDPDLNQWTIITPMKIKRAPYYRCHVIGATIYAVGPYDDRGIECYDLEKDEWEFCKLPDAVQLNICGSVTVKIS